MPHSLNSVELAIIVHALQSLLDHPDAEAQPPRPAVEHPLARAHSPGFPAPSAQNLIHIHGPVSGQVVQVVGDGAGGVDI